jgi:hypothetical protein
MKAEIEKKKIINLHNSKASIIQMAFRLYKFKIINHMALTLNNLILMAEDELTEYSTEARKIEKLRRKL